MSTQQGPDDEIPIIVSTFEILPNGIKMPIGEPQERTISAGALDLLREYPVAAELRDRRHRAREAGHDEYIASHSPRRAVDEAIEVATRVRVTEEIIAVAAEFAAAPGNAKGVCKMLEAAFAAAGFEVVE